MASQGPNSPTNFGGSAANGGTVNWTNPTNAAASDNVYATVATFSNVLTYYLLCTGYGFSIPTGATIDGFLVEVQKKQGPAVGGVTDHDVNLVNPPGYSSENKAELGVDWPTSEAYTSYGGIAELWGDSWTPAEVNDNGFGVGFGANVNGAYTAYVDHVRVTVFYTEPASPGVTKAVIGSVKPHWAQILE